MSQPYPPQGGQQPYGPQYPYGQYQNGQAPYSGQQPSYGPQQPYIPQQRPPQPPPPSPGKSIGKALLRLGAVVLGLLILAGIFGSRGDSSNSSSSEQASSGGASTATTQEAAAADTGPAFPGKKEGDVAVQAGGTVTIDGLAVMSTPLRRGDSTFEKTLCTTLTYANGGNRSTSFGMFDYKLQDPKGAILNPTFFGGGTALDSGDLAPGGKVSGESASRTRPTSKASTSCSTSRTCSSAIEALSSTSGYA